MPLEEDELKRAWELADMGSVLISNVGNGEMGIVRKPRATPVALRAPYGV